MTRNSKLYHRGSLLPLLALAAALVGVLVVTGCGDDDGGGDENNNVNQNVNDNNNQNTAGCPEGTTEVMENVCRLQGEYTNDLTLTADKEWLLSGGVFIGDDVNETVLTVEPGTHVYGETAEISMLVVRRGSRLVAEGTREAPIVFSSAKEVGQRARGDWGGVILNGQATTNACFGQPAGCAPEGEGGTGQYGGDQDDSSCGSLRYVRIEFAGRLLSPENELNGLALQACGSGTLLEYIQVHMGKDDGVEFFGGTASFKYVLVTGASDDSLDWTDGWRGKGQFLVVQQYDDDGDNGIEADNNADENAAEPRSFPTLSNLTIIGSPSSVDSDIGMLLREGTAASISNAVVMGFGDACLDIDHDETFDNAWDGSDLNGNLTVTHSIFQCTTQFDEEGTDAFAVSDFVTTMNPSNQLDDPGLVDPYNLVTPGFTPDASSLARSGASVPSDAYFDQVTFIGGVGPDEDWTAGWTTSERN